ncbi:hypothetical protein V1L52_10940 [Treponema sp. HNW]|uniref:hypothetical protein n=1 Tax=Treponema sp. HNW TaxID=3116654 RepID=UPI003D0AC862
MAPPSETLTANLSAKNVKDKHTVFFYVQGGFDLQKLSGLNKFIMSLKAKSIRKNLEAKDSLSPDEKSVLKMVSEGVSVVQESNLAGITEWYRTKATDT